MNTPKCRPNRGFHIRATAAGRTWGSVRRAPNHPVGPNSINETHTVSGFPAESFISYIFEIEDKDGNRKNEEWSSRRGHALRQLPYPPGNGAPANRIDVAFVADAEVPDPPQARDMLDELEGLDFDGYHRTNNGVKMEQQTAVLRLAAAGVHQRLRYTTAADGHSGERQRLLHHRSCRGHPHHGQARLGERGQLRDRAHQHRNGFAPRAGTPRSGSATSMPGRALELDRSPPQQLQLTSELPDL